MHYELQAVIGNRTLTIETGRLAQQANGAVIVRYGDTVVLVTVCATAEPREGIDFLPLTVDYEERLYAAGKIPGGYLKREGRPSEGAILADRLIDRPLRPLFPHGFRNDVQIVVTVLSADQENDPDILAIIGASAALGVSDIPFDGPVGAVRVGYLDGEFILNPTFTELIRSELDLVVAGTSDGVMTLEAGAREVTEDVFLGAIKFGQAANQESIELQQKLIEACGKPKMKIRLEKMSPEVEAAVSSIVGDGFATEINQKDKLEREEAVSNLEKELVQGLGETFTLKSIKAALESRLKAALRADLLEKGIRPSGRKLDEIRPVSGEVGSLPRTHGSGLFTRGGTQVLTIVTLGSASKEQRIDGIGQEESKRFMHHYNFPPFSVGETGRIGTPRRREIGHGALAERALAPVIPNEEEFPYTIRLVSEVLNSNGSTSMASVCGSTLSLMDAGVPIKAPVAGIAVGLITGENGNYALLTDIEGAEDAFGDMDFKVAGTKKGITAVQMDIKVRGVNYKIMEKALSQAHQARLFILERMQETISTSRPELSKYAPRMTRITINPDKIRNVIGAGGKTIRSIISETKTTIDIDDTGTILIGSTSEEATQKAIKMIDDLTREVEVGEVYTGKVTRVTNFGAFVEILPGKEGLVHLSQLADYPASSVDEVVKIGDEITVMVTEIDQLGRINLSRRALLQGPSNIPGARVSSGSSSPGYPSRSNRKTRPQRYQDRRPTTRDSSSKRPFRRR